MIQYCLERWDKNKDKLRNFLEKTKYLDEYNYEDLLVQIVRLVLNVSEDLDDYENWDFTKIHKIDDGNYQGCLMFLIPRCVYQPQEYDYLMTYIEYGSCSVCDILQEIQCNYMNNKDKKSCIEDFMRLSKDMVMNTIVPYNHGWRKQKQYEQIEVGGELKC